MSAQLDLDAIEEFARKLEEGVGESYDDPSGGYRAFERAVEMSTSELVIALIERVRAQERGLAELQVELGMSITFQTALRDRIRIAEAVRDDARRAGQRYLEEKRAAEAELKALRDGLLSWRSDIERATLDHGWQIVDRIDELLAALRAPA